MMSLYYSRILNLPTTNVAIIGVSLFGLLLALALQKGFLTYTIYDVRPYHKFISGLSRSPQIHQSCSRS